MEAHPGDRIVIEAAALHGRHRVGVVTAVGRTGEGPLYRVRWLDSGHETLLFPGLHARVEPASDQARETNQA